MFSVGGMSVIPEVPVPLICAVFKLELEVLRHRRLLEVVRSSADDRPESFGEVLTLVANHKRTHRKDITAIIPATCCIPASTYVISRTGRCGIPTVLLASSRR